MFGYVKPRRADLLVRDDDFYRAVYCGVCRQMKKKTGRLSSVSLSYDVVFLALVRMLYTDRHIECRKCRCIAHPCKKREMADGNDALVYSARASALLSYHKLKDDIADSGFFKKIPPALALPVFARAKKKAKMGDLDAVMREKLAALHEMERAHLASVDRPADLSGDLLGRVFAFESCDADAALLYDVGYHLGCFVYAADAAEDYDDDCKNDAYNPYRCLFGDGGLDGEKKKDIHTALLLRLSQLEEAVKKLTFDDADAVKRIIDNILYYGLVDRIDFLLPKTDGEKKETERT